MTREPLNKVRDVDSPRVLIWLLLIICTAVYLNSLQGVFLYDDHRHILRDPSINQLWPPGRWLTGEKWLLAERPVVKLSLALNRTFGKEQVIGYHLVNVAVHLLTTVVLLAVVSHTLRRLPYPQLATNKAAFAVTLIWMVHPLQTEAVTYVIQRAESFMALFYLLTIYTTIRCSDTKYPTRWGILAVVSCALGMGSKEVMISAPLVTLLYDRTFLAGTFAEALRRRFWLYLGLVATWGLLFASVGLSPWEGNAAGFGMAHLTPTSYFLAQAGVILHYLRLSLWPVPLCLDYRWPLPANAWAQLVPVILLAALLAGTAWALWRRQTLGFAAASFFLILSPTSSFMPIVDLAVEHRLYLPLALLVTLWVVGSGQVVALLVDRDGPRKKLCATLFFTVTVVLGLQTWHRNTLYHSELGMWKNVVSTAPANARGHSNLGALLMEEAHLHEAKTHLIKAVLLAPRYADAQNNLGNLLAAEGHLNEAQACYHRTLELDGAHAEAHNNLGNVKLRQGKPRVAIDHYRQAVAIQPQYAQAQFNLGQALFEQGHVATAQNHFRQAIRFAPTYVKAYHGLATALAEEGKLDQAIDHFRRALTLRPDSVNLSWRLGNLLAIQGQVPEAIKHFRHILELRPHHAESHHSLGYLLGQQGKLDEAIVHVKAALLRRSHFPEANHTLRNFVLQHDPSGDAPDSSGDTSNLRPRDVHVHYNLGALYLEKQQLSTAEHHFREVLRLRPKHLLAHNRLGKILLQQGRLVEAMTHFRAVLQIEPDHRQAKHNLTMTIEQLDQETSFENQPATDSPPVPRDP